jgi:predicted nuclease of predicted toxin-antitoxin system
LKFLIDENISPKVAELLRARRIDAISTHENGMLGAGDVEVLHYGATEGRCVITSNRDYFLELTHRFFNEGRPHAGVLVIPGSIPKRRFDLIADAVDVYAQTHPDEIYPWLFDFVK